jgi:hypothetical protein
LLGGLSWPATPASTGSWRRKGTDEHGGVITGCEAREVDLPLAFPGPGSFSAQVWSLGSEPKATAQASVTLEQPSKLKLKLVPAGGADAVIGGKRARSPPARVTL